MIPYELHVTFAKDLRALRLCLSDAITDQRAEKKNLKRYLEAYEAVNRLRSILDDIVCDENPMAPNADVFVYYEQK